MCGGELVGQGSASSGPGTGKLRHDDSCENEWRNLAGLVTRLRYTILIIEARYHESCEPHSVIVVPLSFALERRWVRMHQGSICA
jgi:hypothetical protein